MFAPKYLISMPFCLTQHNTTNKEQTQLQKYFFTVFKTIYKKHCIYISYVKKTQSYIYNCTWR